MSALNGLTGRWARIAAVSRDADVAALFANSPDCRSRFIFVQLDGTRPRRMDDAYLVTVNTDELQLVIMLLDSNHGAPVLNVHVAVRRERWYGIAVFALQMCVYALKFQRKLNNTLQGFRVGLGQKEELTSAGSKKNILMCVF